MRRALLLVPVALVAAGLWLGWNRGAIDGGIVAPDPDPAPRFDGALAETIAPALPGDATPDSPARPRSLRGTRIDGGLVLDAAGHFVPTRDARRLFDYFLTATGELPEDALRRRIEHEIERRLPADAAREAADVLQRYLAYRARVRALATDDVPDDDDLDARLATLVALRREMLGPTVAEAFFAEEEADARQLLDTRRLANDPNATAEERAARIEALVAADEADLPDDVRATRAAGRVATALRSAEAEIRARGGDDAEVARLRERLVGPEAAARLAGLDRLRADWQRRVDAFRAARERLQQDPALAPEARAAAIARLLDDSFTAAERRRVQALDRIAADSAGG